MILATEPVPASKRTPEMKQTTQMNPMHEMAEISDMKKGKPQQGIHEARKRGSPHLEVHLVSGK